MIKTHLFFAVTFRYNYRGQLGLGTTASVFVPQLVRGLRYDGLGELGELLYPLNGTLQCTLSVISSYRFFFSPAPLQYQTRRDRVMFVLPFRT